MSTFRPAPCHPDRPYHARARCAACYAADYRRTRIVDPRPARALAAALRAHGWSYAQVAEAHGYERTSGRAWALGRRPLPPTVAAWLAALPPVPAPGSWPPTLGGLRAWLVRHDVSCREFAEFVGVAESTVTTWVAGRQRLPAPIRAWLRAGAPAAWRWAPAPLPNVIGTRSHPRHLRARVRPAPPRRAALRAARRPLERKEHCA